MNKQNSTTKQVNMNRNPLGKGGLQERPEDRSDGRWDKNNSYSYWLNYFKNLSVEEFNNYKEKMSMACSAAYERVKKTIKYLDEFKEVANRTEGMPKQSIELSGDQDNPVQVEVNTTLNKIYGQTNTSSTGEERKDSI
jgi:hypothetical protein